MSIEKIGPITNLEIAKRYVLGYFRGEISMYKHLVHERLTDRGYDISHELVESAMDELVDEGKIRDNGVTGPTIYQITKW